MHGKARLLITGGTGNLGSWLARALEPYYSITLQSFSGRRLEFGNFNYVDCDLRDPKSAKSILQHAPFSYVIHLASYNDQMHASNYGKKALDVTAWGTRVLLELLAEQPIKHFIYLSTFHVYGQTTGKITEDTPVAPRHEYALTHYFAEEYLRMYHRKIDLPYTIYRLTNSFGCPLYKDSSKWDLIINDLSRQWVEHGEVNLKGNPNDYRDYIWMGDVANFIHQGLQNTACQDVHNLSSGVSLSNTYIKHLILGTTDETLPPLDNSILNVESKSIPKQNLTYLNNRIRQTKDEIQKLLI